MSKSTGEGQPAVSVVVPVHNEAGNIAGLVDEIGAAFKSREPFEAIFVNDGSTDETEATLRTLAATRPWLRQMKHAVSCGQSAAIRTGVLSARAPIVVTMDGDGQNDPAFVPQLLHALMSAGPEVGLVQGQRERRRGAFKRFQSSHRQRRSLGCASRRDARYWMRPEGISARRISVVAIFRRATSLHAGADPPRGAFHQIRERARSAARSRSQPLWNVGPAVDRYRRSRRRVLVDLAAAPRAGSIGGSRRCSLI